MPRGASTAVTEGADPAHDQRAALARYYDLDLQDDPGDLDLYLALAARTEGPVLELAVGSGRVAVPLAEAGFEVIGVDNDPHMLHRAHARAGDQHLELIESDLVEVDLGARFGLAILALNSLLLLGDAERQARAIAALARHLRPGGLAVVDVWLPGTDDLAMYDGRLVVEWTRRDPDSGELVSKLAAAAHDPATATVELDGFYDAWAPDGGAVLRTWRRDRLRLVGADELVRMARDAGLAVDTLSADYDGTPFGPGADRVVLVGRLV
jgi:SAM-dependent methyltransferase